MTIAVVDGTDWMYEVDWIDEIDGTDWMQGSFRWGYGRGKMDGRPPSTLPYEHLRKCKYKTTKKKNLQSK